MSASPMPNQQAFAETVPNNFLALRPSIPQKNKTPLRLITAEGQLKIHTAPFRGRFSEVLSEALRSAGLGSRVMVAQFLKGGVDQGPAGMVNLCGRLNWLRPAINCCISEKAPKQLPGQSTHSNVKAVKEIWNTCKMNLLKGDLEQLVLDEVGLAIELGYLREDDFICTLERRPKTMDVILTGPAIPQRVLAIADQVTQLRCSS